MMSMNRWLIATTLLAPAFSPARGEAPSETSQGIIRIVVFETLYQETPRETGPSYAQIYRRGIVAESLRGPFKAGDYIVLRHPFEDYPRG